MLPDLDAEAASLAPTGTAPAAAFWRTDSLTAALGPHCPVCSVATACSGVHVSGNLWGKRTSPVGEQWAACRIADQRAFATRWRAMTLRASISSAPSKIDSTRASTK
jgi:hypothetical protein